MCLTLFLFHVFVQEIYPPKLHEFAYVTDGACEEEEILAMELIMLKVLSSKQIRQVNAMCLVFELASYSCIYSLTLLSV